MSIQDAIDDYVRRITTDLADCPPHVVFVIAVNGTDAPHLAACGRDGHVYDFARMRVSYKPRDSAAFAWTYDDLNDAARMLDDYTRCATGYKLMQPPEAVAEARRRRNSRIDATMRIEMEKAAYSSEHPWACVCGERWKSERGMKQHQRACWRVPPPPLTDDAEGTP